MPLIKSVLELELVKIMDKDSALHEGFPQNEIEAASRWANAINTYAQAVIPTSANAQGAKAAFQSIMSGVNASAGNFFILAPTAFTAYAVQLGLGMQPTFTATPPPVPIVLASVAPIGLAGGSGSDVAKAMATIIDLWFRTGLAINNSSGATVPWS